MNAELLLEHFHRLGDAPDAVPRLRRFILDLAVRGKLVEQDAKDEAVGVLLKRITAEKALLVKEGKKVGSVAMSPVSLHDAPHAIPDGWRWVPFGQLMVSRDGDRRPVSKEERQTRAKKYDYYGASGIIDKIDGYLFDKPLLLIGEDGANLINRSTPIAFIARGKYWVNNHAHVLDGTTESFLRFVELFINAIDLKVYVTGTAQPKMNQAKMNSIPVAVPPEAEQHRIVAKVDELMALCDTLEAAQQKREQQRTQLTAATWQAVTEEGTTDAARFALEQLPALTTRPEQVKALRQTILDLAVRGKLVEQDLKDEPASVLLKKIAAEKEKRIEAGTLRASRALDDTEGEDLDFPLPDGWKPAHLGEVIKLWNGFAFQSSDFATSGVPVIRIGNLQNGLVDHAGAVRVPNSVANAVSSDVWVPQDALLIAMSGATTGKVAINKSTVPILLNQRVGRIEVFLANTDYVRMFFETIIARNLSISFGTAIPNLSTQQINETVIPLPPLAEQGRIVAKVDALMALCDGLEAALREGEEVKGKALEAVLRSDDQKIRRSDTSTSLSAGNGVAATTLTPKRAKAKLPAYEEPEEELALAAEPVGAYAVQALVRRGRGRPRKDAILTTTAERAIGEYLKEHSGWHAKSDVLAATGIDAGHWNAAIKALLEGGQVERMGEKKGARYRGVRRLLA